MMKKGKRLCIVACFLLLASLGLSACGALDDAAELREYEFGADKVPTIKAVLGEKREVTNVDTGVNNGNDYKQYTFKTSSMREDLIAYVQGLQAKGWLVTEGFDLDEAPGTAQLGIDSQDEGKILILSIAFEESKYAVKVTKLEGNLDTK